jgi:hypothetical protein
LAFFGVPPAISVSKVKYQNEPPTPASLTLSRSPLLGGLDSAIVVASCEGTIVGESGHLFSGRGPLVTHSLLGAARNAEFGEIRSLFVLLQDLKEE